MHPYFIKIKIVTYKNVWKLQLIINEKILKMRTERGIYISNINISSYMLNYCRTYLSCKGGGGKTLLKQTRGLNQCFCTRTALLKNDTFNITWTV